MLHLVVLADTLDKSSRGQYNGANDIIRRFLNYMETSHVLTVIRAKSRNNDRTQGCESSN